MRKLVIVALALCFSATGCGDDDGNAGSCPFIPATNDCQPEDADERPYFITPLEIFTGSNGRDLYQAVLVANFGVMNVESDDVDVACVARFGCIAPNQTDIAAVITAQEAGTASVTVVSGSVRETIVVNVASYTPEEYDLGDERYNTPANANATDRVACADCHSGQGGAPHSPLALGGTSDALLLAAVESSAYPDQCENDDGVCSCTPVGTDCNGCAEADCRFSEGYTLTLEAFGGGPGDHTYNLTDAEKTAIMAYMRAIKPDGL